MSQKRQLRIPMFLKFLIGCLLLAGLLIFGGTLVVKNETRLRARGNYMSKQLRRYTGYQESVGRAVTGTLEMIAADTELRTAVAFAVHAPGAEAAPGLAPATVAEVGKGFFQQLSSKNGIKPDMFVVFSAANHVLWAPDGSPVFEDDLDELAGVEKAKGGSALTHRVQVLDEVPYQISAMPIRMPGGDQVIGGILMGVKLQRYFDEFAEQSDDAVDSRIRTTLFDGGKVLASSYPRDLADLGKALAVDHYPKVTVGDDTREVIRTKDGDLDFAAADLDGYRGTDPGTVGRLFMTRSRTDVRDPAAHLPWREIGVAIGLSVIIAMGMAFWITRPIKQFVHQSRGLLQGETDLTQRIVVNSSDETAALADNINQVFARLHNLATDVQAASFHVGASSAEISAASKQMLGGLKDQTLKIEGSTTAVTELSASIQQVASNAAQATEVAEQSNKAVKAAVQRMGQIRGSVEDAAGKMRELGESSKRIGNIVEVIRQISEQTSMLALNASIEAAHAGEQGRGFAVVADEVSSLARRVGQSAKDIEALIQTIKEQTQAAIASMEGGRREVEDGSALVTTTLTGLGQLITVVQDTATAVHEQAVVSDEIARNMDAVRTIAGEVLSGSEESVVQAERLHELAFQLEESIGGFNLDGSKVVPRGGSGGGGGRALPSGPRRGAGATPAGGGGRA